MLTPSLVVQYRMRLRSAHSRHLTSYTRTGSSNPFATNSPRSANKNPFPRAQPAHRIRHQDLPALRLRRDPRRQDHGRAEQIAVFLDRLAGVEADADGQRLALALGEGALEGDRALDGFRDASRTRP